MSSISTFRLADIGPENRWDITIEYVSQKDLSTALETLNKVYAPTPTFTDPDPDPDPAEPSQEPALRGLPVITEEPLALDTVVLDRDGIPWTRTDGIPETEAWRHPSIGRRNFIYIAPPVRMLYNPTPTPWG
jgi:hypothetical protein